MPRVGLRLLRGFAEDLDEARIVAQSVEVAVAAEVADVAIAEVHGALEGDQGGVDHSQQRVTAREVVPGDGPIGHQAHEPTIGLEGAGVETSGGEVGGVDAEDSGVEGVALQDLGEEVQLEVDLALGAE